MHHKGFVLLFATLLVACPQPAPINPAPPPASPPAPPGPLDVTGRWDLTMREASGKAAFAVAFLNQAVGATAYAGTLSFTSLATVSGTLKGDTTKGTVQISTAGGGSFVDAAGTFGDGAYAGTYTAYSATGSPTSGTITMTRTAQTASLNIAVTGPAQAPVTVTASGTALFAAPVVGSITIRDLPRTALTVTGADVALNTAPPAQTVSLSGGSQSVTLAYTHQPFDLSSPQPGINVYNNGQVGLQATVTPDPNFNGTVSLTLQNLPSGVSQTTPISLAVSGNPVSVDISITSSAETLIGDTPARLVATSGVTVRTLAVTIRTRPHRIQLPLARNWVVGADENVYVDSDAQNGVFRIKPDGSTERITNTALPCWYLSVAPDGSLWTDNFGFTRIDPITKTVETLPNPTGQYGCAISTPDGKKRVWYSYFGLWRADLLNGTNTLVTGLNGLGFGSPKMVANTYWGTSGSSLVGIDTDSLKVTKYDVPISADISTFFINGTNVALSAGPHLYTYDLTSGVTTEHLIPGIAFKALLGQDAQGNLWVSSSDQWVRYNPSTKQILRLLPELGQGQIVVTPSGAIWYAGDGVFHVLP